MFFGLDFPSFAIVMMFYSFIGWFYESTVYSICEQGKLMNRGYFIGPYCPIYSVVAIVNAWLLRGIDNPWMVMFISGLTVSLIEYFTSYILERLFHARYWDYSKYPLNLNGRVSLPSSLFFGLAVLFLVKILHPFTLFWVGSLSSTWRLILCILFCVMFFADAIITTVGMINLNKRCKQIYDMMDQMLDEKFESLNAKKDYFAKFAIVSKGKNAVVQIKGLSAKFMALETRMLRNRKDFKSTKYGEIIEKLRIASDSYTFGRPHDLDLQSTKSSHDAVAMDAATVDSTGEDAATAAKN